jgi:ABC-2 type transport system ATP-binding protein
VIKVLTGVLRPTAGRAELFGKDVSLPEARRGLGYVPENPSLYDYLTPLEILTMGLAIHGVKLANARQHCLQWLERFALAQVASKRVRSFSKGMTQRVALAHAMAIQPRLLILDEPLSGLDPVGRKDVVDILGEYRAAGGTIFLTSHVLHDVERLADRFGLIHRGELVTVQAPGDLLHAEQTVTVRSAGPGRCPDSRPKPMDEWRADVRRDQLWHLLDALRTAGHLVLEIRPSLTLEDVFFRHLESAPLDQPAGDRST